LLAVVAVLSFVVAGLLARATHAGSSTPPTSSGSGSASVTSSDDGSSTSSDDGFSIGPSSSMPQVQSSVS
jgi:hypothetical protein